MLPWLTRELPTRRAAGKGTFHCSCLRSPLDCLSLLLEEVAEPPHPFWHLQVAFLGHDLFKGRGRQP